ncbi:SDR family NAD(P)-dependent oxidoreductase [Pseudoclavibacter terrae]|uniref:SDR family NAD(P)-dependent oxidoreductase n=1 Tax=Pseudoclavibacter terrae TaxID=1530195 RepID=UPI00232C3D34|nr:SDR family NAD(P)-dependent oxidoreductase [Pseudoclavibacter terrae]
MKTFAITGATQGVGYFAAEELARRGHHVVLLGRSVEKLNRALISITEQVPDASTSRILLDLTSSESIASAATSLSARERLDGVLLNAAHVSPGAHREQDSQGRELTMSTNHLGHFELTAQLMDALVAAKPVLDDETSEKSRVVAVGSLATRIYPFDLEDWQSTHLYEPKRAYAASKHALEMFTFELDRRLQAAGAPVEALVVDPGIPVNGATPARAGVSEPTAWQRFASRLAGPFAHGKHRAAAIAVHALTSDAVAGGDYLGPARTLRGTPVKLDKPATQRDRERATRLWSLSEASTSATFRLSETVS